MAKIHFVLQGKGGVGKSFVSSMLYQYFLEKGLEVSGFDTDPVNASFAGYKSFRNITEIDIMDGNSIDTGRFDELIELIYKKPGNEHVVIDNGAATFIPLCDYMAENKGFQQLEDLGHEIYLHVVITGGQALADTLDGFHMLIDNFNRPVVVWLNPYFGDIAVAGQKFEEFDIFDDYSSSIIAIIQIPYYTSATLRKNMEELLAMRETFNAFISGSSWLMQKARIQRYWREVITEIDKARIT